MMWVGALIPFNGVRPWLESAKQGEVLLAVLVKMLQISHFGTGDPRRAEKGRSRLYFRGIWLTHPD
jgi:hypothetical protein